MTKPNPVPVRPQFERSVTFPIFQRAAFAAFAAAAQNRTADRVQICQNLFPDDAAAPLLLSRAAVDGATTTGWGSSLVTTAYRNFLTGLGPQSAASQIIGRGLTVNFEPGASEQKLPNRSGAVPTMPWVAQGAPIPMRQGVLSSVTLGPPRKMGIIVAMTKELAKRSSAQQVFQQLLREEAAVSLDAAYFSDAAASSSAVAGLLNGVTETADTTDGLEANLAALAAAVSIGGSGEVVFVMAPERAAMVPILMEDPDVTIYASQAVPTDRIIAVDPSALIHGFDTEPDIVASIEGVLHHEMSPAQISTAGTPNVVAAPTRSLFQTDCVALRVIADVAFVKRRANAAAFMDVTDWAA